MGAFKLGKMTLRSLFKKPETVLYPFEEPEHPAEMKGLISFDYHDCIYCGICQKKCPTECIEVNKADSTWSINHFGCIQCRTCIRECPKSCLSMNPVLVHPATEKSTEIFERPELTEEEQAAAAAKEAEKAARIKAAKEAKAARDAEKQKAAERDAEN